MGNKYVLTSKARDDLISIFDYVSEQLYNSEAALRLIEKFENRFEEITSFPDMYPVFDDERLNIDNLRKCKVDNFIIVYQFNERLGLITIFRVVYHRYDIK